MLADDAGSGVSLGAGSFVSFAYDGTSLLPGFVITIVNGFSATFQPQTTQTAAASILSSLYDFTRDLGGTWSIVPFGGRPWRWRLARGTIDAACDLAPGRRARRPSGP